MMISFSEICKWESKEDEEAERRVSTFRVTKGNTWV